PCHGGSVGSNPTERFATVPDVRGLQTHQPFTLDKRAVNSCVSRTLLRLARLFFQGVGKSGNPPAWGAGKRGFKSHRPDCYSSSRGPAWSGREPRKLENVGSNPTAMTQTAASNRSPNGSARRRQKP